VHPDEQDWGGHQYGDAERYRDQQQRDGHGRDSRALGDGSADYRDDTNHPVDVAAGDGDQLAGASGVRHSTGIQHPPDETATEVKAGGLGNPDSGGSTEPPGQREHDEEAAQRAEPTHKRTEVSGGDCAVDDDPDDDRDESLGDLVQHQTGSRCGEQRPTPSHRRPGVSGRREIEFETGHSESV